VAGKIVTLRLAVQLGNATSAPDAPALQRPFPMSRGLQNVPMHQGPNQEMPCFSHFSVFRIGLIVQFDTFEATASGSWLSAAMSSDAMRLPAHSRKLHCPLDRDSVLAKSFAQDAA
jgi:hypothetical protein